MTLSRITARLIALISLMELFCHEHVETRLSEPDRMDAAGEKRSNESYQSDSVIRIIL